MGTLRSKEMLDKLTAFKAAGGLSNGCNLCKAPAIETFKYWKIIDTKFPYDQIAEVHHMMVPLGHYKDADSTEEEWNEFLQIKKDVLKQRYEFLIEAGAKYMSIPDHFHLHLIIAKPE